MSGQVTINFRTRDGVLSSVRVRLDDTLKALYDSIADMLHIPVSQLSLIYEGKQLPNSDKPLSAYPMYLANDTLFALVKQLSSSSSSVEDDRIARYREYVAMLPSARATMEEAEAQMDELLSKREALAAELASQIKTFQTRIDAVTFKLRGLELVRDKASDEVSRLQKYATKLAELTKTSTGGRHRGMLSMRW